MLVYSVIVYVFSPFSPPLRTNETNFPCVYIKLMTLALFKAFKSLSNHFSLGLSANLLSILSIGFFSLLNQRILFGNRLLELLSHFRTIIINVFKVFTFIMELPDLSGGYMRFISDYCWLNVFNLASLVRTRFINKSFFFIRIVRFIKRS